jgi:UDP-N-acetylmuramoyl-tripeptide--D-alanyl-D-alanine ligase
VWTEAAVTAALGIAAHAGDVDVTYAGVSTDTRTLKQGELFVALRGVHHDAHAYLLQAHAAGATGVVVDHVPAEAPQALRYYVVPDTLAALGRLARAHRRRLGIRVCAVAGSNGKTTTKDLLRAALSPRLRVHATQGNLNNLIGAPLTLLRTPDDADVVIAEIGTNAPGEIEQLARLVRPHLALITAIAPAHLGFFPSLEAIAEAKGEVFRGLEPGGIAVLPVDSPHFKRLRELALRAGAVRVIGFGEGDGADARLLDTKVRPDGSDVAMSLDGRRLAYRVGAPGRHWVINSLAVVASAFALGADPARAAAALAGFEAPKGRGRRHRIERPGGPITLIDESYNANPASMRAALALLENAPGRRIAALGDMLELGERGPELHAELAEVIERLNIDRVYTVGPLMRRLHDALPPKRRAEWRQNATQLSPIVAGALRKGDTLLVKGSLGSRMGAIVDALLAERPVAAVQEG